MNSLLKSLKLDFRIKVGYGAAFILLLVSYILIFFANTNLRKQSQDVSHTNAVITHLTELISYMKDAETGVRGYIIRKDSSFLEPYIASFPMVKSAFEELKGETKANTQHQIQLYKIKALIDRKYQYLEQGLINFRASNYNIYDSRLHTTTGGKLVMDSIRVLVDDVKATEEAVLADKTRKFNDQYLALRVISITSFFVAIVFAIFGLLTYLNEKKARKLADQKVSSYQEQLQKRIEELDIANKELMQMRLAEKFAATGRIARTIAHEVRNPLTNIDLAMSQIRTETPPPDASIAVLFDMVTRNSKRINELITELLNATRFTDLIYQSVSVTRLLDGAIELAHDRIDLNHVGLEKNYAAEPLNILADPDKISLVFLNIIVNAIEAVEPLKGILKINAYREQEKIVIEICDNGVGLDEASLANLFEPYYTTKLKGTGLGLTNAQNIILNHKGTIHVESDPGKGTCFIIRFLAEQA